MDDLKGPIKLGINWDRRRNNSENEMFKELYMIASDFIDNTTNNVYDKIIDSSRLIWKESVYELADLPTEDEEGSTRAVEKTDEVYRFNGESWELIQRLNHSAINNLENKINNTLEESLYYEGVSVSKHYDELSETFYYLTKIDHKDKDGNMIKLKHETMLDKPISTREFSIKNHATVATNASWENPKGSFSGVTIKEGVVMPYTDLPEASLLNRYILGIKNDNTLVSYHGSTDPAVLLDDGIINATTGFTPLVEDGLSVREDLLLDSNSKTKHPRQSIGQYDDKSLVFLTCGGRGFEGEGMTSKDVIRVFLGLGVRFAHMLDGGGSAQTNVRGVQVNKTIDKDGTYERKHVNTLFVAKEVGNVEVYKDLINSQSILGDLNQLINENERYFEKKTSELSEVKADKSNVNVITPIKGDDMDNNWDGELYVRRDGMGLVNIYGYLYAGDLGATRTNIAQLNRSDLNPSILQVGIVVKANPPHENYNGFTILRDGKIILAGKANDNVKKGDYIHVNVLYYP